MKILNLLILSVACSLSCAFAQQTSTANGACSTAIAGNNNAYNITCTGIGKEQGDKIIKLLIDLKLKVKPAPAPMTINGSQLRGREAGIIDNSGEPMNINDSTVDSEGVSVARGLSRADLRMLHPTNEIIQLRESIKLWRHHIADHAGNKSLMQADFDELRPIFDKAIDSENSSEAYKAKARSTFKDLQAGLMEVAGNRERCLYRLALTYMSIAGDPCQ